MLPVWHYHHLLPQPGLLLPSGCNRLSRPYRTHFPGGLVADSNDDVHFWCLRISKFIPYLAPEPIGWQMAFLQKVECVGIYLSCWITASTVCVEAASAGSIKIRLCKDASRRISGIKKQNIKCAISHDLSSSLRAEQCQRLSVLARSMHSVQRP